MAIIRIKRTTTTNLPSGLTFGELAFVQGSGATANRLYIAGSSDGTAWIGAEILNSPTYWSGLTASTTLATVSAIENRIVAGGGVTFASDITVNISAGKYFGKYTRGDIIPATGKTVKEVVELSLSEVITPTISLSPSGTVSFGQTSGSLSITVGYTIKTAGASAASSTLEFRYGSGTWTTLSSALKDDTKGTDVAYSSEFTHTTWNRSADAESNGGYATTAFNYRYTVQDTFGASASTTGLITPASSSSPTVTSFTAAGNVSAPETNAVREKGNTYSTITATVNRVNVYVPLTNWKLQYSENSGAYADTDKPSAGWQSVSGNPSTVSISTNHAPTNTVNRVDYRVVVRDVYRDTIDSNGVNVTPSGQPGVSFGYKIFYGATASIPTNSAEVRNLPGVSMASGTNAFSNPFTLNSGTAFKNFVIALPTNITVLTQSDTDAIGASPGYALSGSLTAVNDVAGNSKSYNVYTLTNGDTYSINHRHVITTTGTVA
tara:strand:- start:4989 stop:6464 length:1476 start_codon:yes stop_codon:yes gene_type:complete